MISHLNNVTITRQLYNNLLSYLHKYSCTVEYVQVVVPDDCRYNLVSTTFVYFTKSSDIVPSKEVVIQCITIKHT